MLLLVQTARGNVKLFFQKQFQSDFALFVFFGCLPDAKLFAKRNDYYRYEDGIKIAASRGYPLLAAVLM
jgi:hypothetical protein